MDENPALGRLAFEARKRGGCFTRRRALAEGVSKARLEHLLTTGAVTSVHPGRGVYRFGGAPDSWEARLHAACLLLGDDAVVSHRSAARLWRAPDFEETDALDLTVVGRERGFKLPDGITLHLTKWLPAAQVVRVGQHPRVTSATRTCRDLARYLGTDPLTNIVVDLHRRRLTSPADLAACHAELGRAWGAPTMRSVLGQLDENCLRAASRPEVALHLGIVADPRIPPHVLNHRVKLPTRTVVFDVAWPHLLAAAEVDSERYHGTGYDRRRDAARDHDTRAANWVVERVPVADLADMAAVLDRLAAFLAEAERSLPGRLA